MSNPKKCEEGKWYILSQINCFTLIPYPELQNFGCAAEWHSELSSNKYGSYVRVLGNASQLIQKDLWQLSLRILLIPKFRF